MGEFDYRNKDSNHDYNYTPQKNAHSAQDNLGNDWRMNILNRFAQTKVSNNPLSDTETADAVKYNQRSPRKDYNWEAIAAKIGSPSTANDEKMALTIADQQTKYKAELEQTDKKNAHEYKVDGKLGNKTIMALELKDETTGYVRKQKENPQIEEENEKLQTSPLNTNAKAKAEDEEDLKISPMKDELIETKVNHQPQDKNKHNLLTDEKVKEAVEFNHQDPQKYYTWDAIGKKLGSSSTENDEEMAQTIARKQKEYIDEENPKHFKANGKLTKKTIENLKLKDTVLTIYFDESLKVKKQNPDFNEDVLVTLSDSDKNKGSSKKSDQKDSISSNNNLESDINISSNGLEKESVKSKKIVQLTSEQIKTAITENNKNIKEYEDKYEGNTKYEKKRILKSVDSPSKEEFDEKAVLAIAQWQAKHKLTINGIYDDECRKVDLVFAFYNAATDNTDINILFVISQLCHESGWRFQNATNNYGGIKAPTEKSTGVNPLDRAHAALCWTHEYWTEKEAKKKIESYNADPDRTKTYKNTGQKVFLEERRPDKGTDKYRVQEWFQTFDTLEDFIRAHRNNIVNNVKIKVTKVKAKAGANIYEADTSKQIDKIKEIIQDADAVLSTIQSGSCYHYASGVDYVKHVTERMQDVESILSRYSITTDRKQTPQKETEET